MREDEEIQVWLNGYKMDALVEALEAQGLSDIGTIMQERLVELYADTVPFEKQQAIRERIDAEHLAEQQALEAKKCITAFHIVERDSSRYFTLDEEKDFLTVAQSLRSYLRKAPGSLPDTFANAFARPNEITTEDFNRLVGVRMENTGKVVGVYEINLDKQEFSAVNIMDGWKTFVVDDVSTAAYHAFRRQGIKYDERWERFFDHLDGKEIESAGHLSSQNISFSEEIIAMDDDRLNFCMETWFDVDSVFGTNVCTSENDDWINVYADYDCTKGEVKDTLDIVLHKGDGSDEEMNYPLNAAEREVLRIKMDEYCRQQTGLSLAAYAAQIIAESQPVQTEPQM